MDIRDFQYNPIDRLGILHETRAFKFVHPIRDRDRPHMSVLRGGIMGGWVISIRLED